MGIPSFTQGYPPDGSTLGNTKSTIRNNLDGTFLALSVDHRDQNESNPGYHTIIHDPAQTVGGQAAWVPDNPGVIAAIAATSIPGVGQFFDMNYTPNFAGAVADTQLMHLSGLGGISQLTGNRAASEGWAWMGGILVQWGTATGATGGTVTFTSRSNCIPFPNNLFIVTVTQTGTLPNKIISTSGYSKTSFNWNASIAGSATFVWFALGN